MTTPATVDEYLAGLPAERRPAIETLRSVVRAAAPDTTETIAYGMPAYRTGGGRFVLSFGSYKRHDSLFPASGVVVEALGAEIAPYLDGRATLRFPADRPLPLELIRRVVEIRVAEIAGRRVP
jgi:uncharacterized protein YdhG (YjbR/CyaY superfamily)